MKNKVLLLKHVKIFQEARQFMIVMEKNATQDFS